MSNIEAVIKVTDQLISRVFNQRQFTSGEINYLCRGIAGDRHSTNLEDNFDKLLKINENVCLVADANGSESRTAYEDKARDVCNQVSSLVERAERLLKLGDEIKEKNEKRITEKVRDLSFVDNNNEIPRDDNSKNQGEPTAQEQPSSKN